MESLTIFNQPEIDNKSQGIALSSGDMQIIDAQNSTKICDLYVDFISKELFTPIKMAFWNANYKVKGDTQPEQQEYIQLMAMAIANELKNNYNNLTIDEVRIAFNRGVLKNYGEYKGLSVVEFVFFISSYKKERQEAIYRKSKSEERTERVQEPNKFDIELKEDASRKHCVKIHNIYKKTGILYDFGNPCYDFLEKKGIIKLDLEEKQMIKDLAIERMKSMNSVSISNAKSIFQRNELMNLTEKIDNNDKDIEGKIKAECKRIALQNYFNSVDYLIF